MSEHGDRAEAIFRQGYGCAQSVAMAFATEMGLEPGRVACLAAGFGGGFGRMREVCGAFSGLTLALGALYGSDDPARRSELYAELQALAARFKAENGGGTLLCRELLGLKKAEGSPVAAPRDAKFYQSRPCARLVRLAADLLDGYMSEHPIPGGRS